MLKRAILTSMLLAAAGTASAADSWSGWYAGFNAGQGSGDADASAALSGNWSVETVATQTAVLDALSGKVDGSGTSWGLFAGYDHDFDNGFVLGIEAEYGDFGANGDDVRSVLATGSGLEYTVGQGFDAGDSYSIRPRFGYAGDQVMVYLTAGWAWTDVDFATVLTETGLDNGYAKIGGASKSLSQTVLGAGLEFRFGGNWSGRLEYLRYDGGDVTYDLDYAPGSTFPNYGETVTQEFQADVIRFGLAYRF
ncbi:outer membrane beta-barrel protein [Arenimonas sp. GDDSR-1]|uniref:outer membrane protein n=1 Tax=Arenimonas sp. GDDSR-1 TaxID=2950125 RepID=UPI002602E1A5|nr:outer membrane beta-barrel protein [Arenimonas sp. GDDSR-1]